MILRLHPPLPGLDDRFYQEIAPTPVATPELLLWNAALADDLSIETSLDLDRAALAEIFSGNRLPAGGRSLAQGYAGHQFGHFVPQLGDGRAHLIGQLRDSTDGWQDVQLKGSGPSRYSRGGDGRCALGPAVREYIMSEALHALGVPTSRCLSVVTTGEVVQRDRALPGAIVTRVAASHLRVGTLQHYAARGDTDAVETLWKYAIHRHAPELINQPDGFFSYFQRVTERQVRLITEWLRVGFIHGVMNTDNTALSGETIDYGPCAMMNAYSPNTVFSSIDRRGRYAFANQPNIAVWNMARLAECLVPVIDDDEDRAVERLTGYLQSMPDRFEKARREMMSGKLGLADQQDADGELISELLQLMEANDLDYTLTFQDLASMLDDNPSELPGCLNGWAELWHERIKAQPGAGDRALALMGKTNPVVIPRNHDVESILAEVEQTGSDQRVEDFLDVLRNPYVEQAQTARYQQPPADGDGDYQTFCGT